MVACELGYLCDVCGEEVEPITASSLYLRYVLGEVSPLALPSQRDRHLRCHPELSQYIVDPGFPPVLCDGPFDKRTFDADFRVEEEARVTRGWRRLNDVARLGLTIPEYPLPEVLAKWNHSPH